MNSANLKSTEIIRERLRECVRKVAPPPKLTVSEWADRYRQLSSEASSEAGSWKTDRASFQRGIMDAVNDPDVKEIVVMSSAQIGKTEMVNNIIGYFISQDPAPIILVMPTIEMANSWSKDRFAPMLKDSPTLKNLVKEPRAKNSSNTILHKTFPGGHITIVGSNSPASLASRPVRIVICDEVDRYPDSVGSEGDAVNLAKVRSKTFFNRKVILTSTPTIKGQSRIENAYENSDQRRFYVPCVDCGNYDYLRWENVNWQKDENEKHMPETAHIVCEKCGSVLTDRDKREMIKQGEWRSNSRFNGIAGFHLSELYSPWVSLSELVTNFLDNKNLPETLKTFVNTSLGESFEITGESLDYENLHANQEVYEAELPDGVLVVTAGVDVQQNRIEVEVLGHGMAGETWSIDYKVFLGDPSLSQVWEQLDSLLERKWKHENGMELKIVRMCVDSGFLTQSVERFVKPRQMRGVYAVKGVSGSGRPLISISKRKKNDINLVLIGVDTAKEELYSRLKIQEQGSGYCHFPINETYNDEYFKQLTSEKIITKFKNGRPIRQWVSKRSRNEALDCRIYATAGLEILNPDLKRIQQNFLQKAKEEMKPKQTKKENRNSSFLGNSYKSKNNFATSWDNW